MVALVATIHVFAPERPGERHFVSWRLPFTSQGVDARDKPEHDGKAREPRPHLLPDGRRWRGAPLSSASLMIGGVAQIARCASELPI